MGKSGAFVSYSRSDGEAFAAALRERLLKDAPDVRVWQDRPEIEGGVGWWRQIEEALERVEFLLIVMTPGAFTSETTRKEWRAARQSGVCVFPVKGPGYDYDDTRIPGWMRRSHVYDLDVQWETFVAHLRRGCQATRVPFMAPPLPTGLVARPREFEALRALVLDAQTGDTVAITTTLAGAGGFGKTTLASALCHDDDVVAAFDDGVLWATLGQTPNVQGELTRLFAALTGERPGFISIEDAAQALADKLEHQRCLIVIDDVWDVAHLRPFLRGGPNCARLVTTRQAQVAAEGKRIAVDEMTSPEAVALLAARLAEVPVDREALRKLSHRLGEWPLLLRLAGSALRQRVDRGDSLAGALRYVDRALDKRGVMAFDREHPVDRHEAVASTLAMSLELLDAGDRDRCAELSIFPEDTRIPTAVLGELWGLDDIDTEEALTRLHDGSLIEFDLGTGTVGVHDVMRACFATRLGDGAATVHARLLKAWPDRHALPHRYAWRWVGHHLVGAGRGAEFRALLLDFAWLQHKLDATGVYALLADFAFLPPDRELLLLHNVLRLSSHVLGRDKSQLASQLMGRLASPERDLGLSIGRPPAPAAARWLRPIFASLVGPGGALLRTFECPGTPSSVAATPDGRHIVAGTEEGRIIVWDLASGTLARTLRTWDETDAGAPAAVETWGSAFVMMADGRVLLPSSRGLVVWDPADDAPPRTLLDAKDVAGSLAVSRDGKAALLGSRKGVLTLLDLERGEVVAPLIAQPVDAVTGERVTHGVAHRLGIAAIAFSGDGRLGVTGSYDKTVRVWYLAAQALVDTLYPPHDGIVYAVAAARDVALAASGGADRAIRIWDLVSLTCRTTLTGHTHRVYDVAFSDDGRKLLSASHDRTIRLWDVAAGTTLATLSGHADAVVAVSFLPGEQSAVSASKDGTIRVWQLEAADQRAPTQEHEGHIQAVVVSPDGRLAATGGQDRAVRLWDVAAGRVARVLSGHHDVVSALALCPAKGLLVSGSYDRRLLVWPLAGDAPPTILKGHTDAISAVTVDPEGTLALSASWDGDLIRWDLVRGRSIRRWDAHRRGITFVAALPGWATALTGSMDGDIRVWNLANGACQRTVQAHLGGVTAGALAPQGDLLLTGGADGTLRLWRLPSFELVTSVVGHAGKVGSLCFDASGEFAFSSSHDRCLKAWAIPALDSRSAFVSDSAITAAGVSGAGDVIVAGDAQGCAHFLRFG